MTIGTGAKVIGPVTIGAGACIGANAVVLEDVPAGAYRLDRHTCARHRGGHPGALTEGGRRARRLIGRRAVAADVEAPLRSTQPGERGAGRRRR